MNKEQKAIKKWGKRDVTLVKMCKGDYMRHENTYNLYSVLSKKARLVPFYRFADISAYLENRTLGGK